MGACRESLRRLGADKVALAQLHWSTANYAPLQERLMWDGLVAIYEAGLVDAVGLSNYGPRQLGRIHAYLSKRGVPLASVQVQYSLLSRGKEQEAVKAACDDLGLALIGYSPLALGLLTGKYSLDAPEELPGGPRGLLFRQILPGLDPRLGTLQEVAAARRKTPSQVAITWCMAKGEIAALEAAADRVPRAMQQNIFQTR